METYKFFPIIDKNLHSKLKIDEIGLYSISTPKNASIISQLIKKNINYNDNIIITDAMAGVGGNTISFSSYFYFVNSIEIDETRFNYLVSNSSLYNKENILCIKGNFFDYITKLYQDILFLDPPWGGKTYKDNLNFRIKINEEYIEDICNYIIEKGLCNMIALKLPLNYDLEYMNMIKKEIIIERMEKMLLIIIKL
jgi:16S rRNA G966 N2-methylase RsmD